MNHFERITTQSSEPFGLPTIRDTGITVSDVVRPIVSGEKSVQAVLDAYPALELEDVHQALAFAVSDLAGNIPYVRSETFDHLTGIISYSATLLNPTAKQQLIELMSLDTISKLFYTNSTRAKFPLNLFWDWSKNSYTKNSEDVGFPMAMTVAELVESIERDFTNYQIQDWIQITFEYPQISEILKLDLTNETYLALEYLCIMQIGVNKGSVYVSIIPSEMRKTVNVKIIHTRKAYDGLDILIRTNYAHQPAHLGKLILSQTDVDLKTTVNDQNVTFTFDLPIVDTE